MSCDVLIVGGGTGGCAAAMAVTSMGLSVILTDENSWIGGQLTSQLVPPDEHPWIEQFGCTDRYRNFREGVRSYYKKRRPLDEVAMNDRFLNPGNGWVSRLCHEPAIGHRVLGSHLQRKSATGLLQILKRTVPTAVDVVGDSIASVWLKCGVEESPLEVEAKYVLDATELGDLLPMAKAEYRIGAESQDEFGEEHAVSGPPQPTNVQGITWCYALAHDEGSHRVIDRPENYDFWANVQPSNWPGKLFDFIIENPETGTKRELPLYGRTPEQHYTLFSYRQIIDPKILDTDEPEHPVTVVNWPMNDYFLETILDVEESAKQHALAASKEQGLCLLYWLQTEAPRHDGGTGYPGLYLRPDIAGTPDGFAQYPYIRESRRMKTTFTVTEPMVSLEANRGKSIADPLPKSVGIGMYRMDLHPSCSGARTIDLGAVPFQIPLGSLIPVRMRNLLPACKNLGVTHITNGCYRLHPVEWNIGESAGLLAAFCVLNRVTPAEVESHELIWYEFQRLLIQQGIELAWPQIRGY